MTRPGGKGQAQGSSAQPIHSGKSKEEEDDEDNEAEVSCVLQDEMKWHGIRYFIEEYSTYDVTTLPLFPQRDLLLNSICFNY